MAKAGNILAWFLVISGALKLFFSLIVIYVFDSQEDWVRYLLGSGTSGDHADKAFIILGAGLALGMLSSIARNLENLSKE